VNDSEEMPTPRSGAGAGKVTNKRILALLDKPPPTRFARWTVPIV
jgi:hypothetical protein